MRARHGSIARRDFLRLVLATTAGLALPGCGSDDGDAPPAGGGAPVPDAGGDGPTPAPLGWFDALWELRDAVRTSPDHLAYEAARLVAKGDPAAIFAFVRDRIATLPGAEDALAAPARLWGARGALRAGAGSMRDKAELLAKLYGDAGLSARVVGGATTASDAEIRASVLRAFPRTFAPAITDADRARWHAAAGAPPRSPAGDGAALDPDGATSAALADAILATIPGALPVAPFDWAPGAIPLVEVSVSGATKHANPNLATAAFGESRTVDAPVPVDPAEDVPVTIEILATSTRDPAEQTLARGAWRVADLVGRRVRVAFVPVVDPLVALASPIDQLGWFVPALVPEGRDLRTDDAAKQAVTGDAFGLGGERLAVATDGSATLDGRPVATTPSPASLVASVASVSAEASAEAFADVTLRLAARDAGGAGVEGLTAGAFRVEDEGRACGAVVLANAPIPPRVLFLLDGSASIPDEYRGAALADTLRAIATSILAALPGATFAARFLEGPPAPYAWVATADELAASIAGAEGNSSSVWDAAASAADPDVGVVVLVTDGQADDAPTPRVVSRLVDGPAFVCAGVGGVVQETLDRIAALSHGVSRSIAARDEIATAVVDLVAPTTDAFYLLRYRAPQDGPAHRHVKITIGAAGPSATAEYDVPAAPLGGAQLTSIAIRVRIGDDAPVTRVLAGRATDAPAPSDLDAVHLALFGSYVLSFEPGAPTPSAVLDDLVTGALARAPVAMALGAGGTAEDVVAALAQGTRAVGLDSFVLSLPLAHQLDGTELVWDVRPRASLAAVQPRPGAVARWVDLLEASRWSAADEAPADRAARTARRSARLALAEAVFPTSTAGLLAGRSLVAVGPFASIPDGFPTGDASPWPALFAEYDGYWKIVPADGSVGAMWAVEPTSGSVFGVLPDGTGGGAAETMADIERAKKLYDVLGIVSTLFGASFGFGVWVALSKAYLLQVLRCTIAIQTMDGAGAGLDATIDDLVCGFLKDSFSEAVSQVGEGKVWHALFELGADAFDLADDLKELATGEDISCKPLFEQLAAAASAGRDWLNG